MDFSRRHDLIELITEKLGDGYDVAVKDIEKINGGYEALQVGPKGRESLGISMNLSDFLRETEDLPVEEAAEKAIEITKKRLAMAPEINISSLRDYEGFAKERLCLQVVSAKKNAEMLKAVPHFMIEDLAVVYRVLIEESEEGTATTVITNQLLDDYGVSPEQLKRDALANAPKLRPSNIRSMAVVLKEIMQKNGMPLDFFPPIPEEDETMFVASVSHETNGASVIAYKGFFEAAAERLGCSFYVLPSSIHEVILVPDRNEEFNPLDLRQMVTEVNMTMVDPKDKLSDNVYYYDAESKIFGLADRFSKRQAMASVV